jgi:hypothetical protein
MYFGFSYTENPLQIFHHEHDITNFLYNMISAGSLLFPEMNLTPLVLDKLLDEFGHFLNAHIYLRIFTKFVEHAEYGFMDYTFLCRFKAAYAIMKNALTQFPVFAFITDLALHASSPPLFL